MFPRIVKGGNCSVDPYFFEIKSFKINFKNQNLTFASTTFSGEKFRRNSFWRGALHNPFFWKTKSQNTNFLRCSQKFDVSQNHVNKPIKHQQQPIKPNKAFKRKNSNQEKCTTRGL